MDKKSLLNFSKIPIKLLENRVWRTYTGGKLIDEWKGALNSSDNQYPEEWVASTVKAKNVGREHIQDEGLTKIYTEDGSEITLQEVINSAPEVFLGKKHTDKYGPNMAVLVKVLDSAERLAIQVHPNKEFALNEFGSSFGKTEAWYILGGRQINGVEPYVLLGFKEGVTKEHWKALFYKQDVDGMINSLHRIAVKPGDVFLINGGVPHAIGSGCFLIEIQEPTDYTLRVEKTTPSGYRVADSTCHLGLGFDKLFDCFNYETANYKETVSRWKLEPELIREEQGGRETVLIGRKNTDCFRMHSLEVNNKIACSNNGVFCIAVILEGKGSIVVDGYQMKVKQGDEFFIPASIEDITWHNEGQGDMKIILCYPPD